MPMSNKGNKYILCIKNDVTNYFITVPIHQSQSEEIGDALTRTGNSKILHTRLYKYGPG